MADYPNDDQFREETITSVSKEENGSFVITCEDGWSMWCGKDWTEEPLVGQRVRFYGEGIGRPVRGLFIDGKRVWYRTAAEDKDHTNKELYGADATEWLARWDAGKSVWSIEMGGLGPGYEQCIQIVAAEVLRWMLANKPDLASEWSNHDGPMSKAVSKLTEPLGLSGAQWGAGVNLAAFLYKDGPVGVMNDSRVEDRKIQVSRIFPSLAA